MKKLANVVKVTLLLAVLALTVVGAFPTEAQAGLWVLCYNPGGTACEVTFETEDGDPIVTYHYANWIIGNE